MYVPVHDYSQRPATIETLSLILFQRLTLVAAAVQARTAACARARQRVLRKERHERSQDGRTPTHCAQPVPRAGEHGGAAQARHHPATTGGAARGRVDAWSHQEGVRVLSTTGQSCDESCVNGVLVSGFAKTAPMVSSASWGTAGVWRTSGRRRRSTSASARWRSEGAWPVRRRSSSNSATSTVAASSASAVCTTSAPPTSGRRRATSPDPESWSSIIINLLRLETVLSLLLKLNVSFSLSPISVHREGCKF